MSSHGFSWDKFWAELDQYQQSQTVAPEGAFSVNDYAKRYGIPRETARRQLEGLVASGLLRTRIVLLPSASGVRRTTRLFWPAELETEKKANAKKPKR